MTPHPLANFEIQVCYQNEPRFIGVYSRENLSDKIKDGAYVVNLDEYSDIGTHWIALYVNNIFSLCTGLVKELLKATRNKKKKHHKIVMQARSKLNSIENKISAALINNQIIHEDLKQLSMKKEIIEI